MRAWKFTGNGILLSIALTGLFGCISQIGLRQFATPPEPSAQQAQSMTVLDDGTVVFTKDRLEISLQALKDDYLNRQFAASSNKGAESTNPYTYGDWEPWGQEWTPQRFTVVLLKVKNYEYPKVFIDPEKLYITTNNGRYYESLDTGLLEDYFSPYLGAYAGLQRRRYEAITDQLVRTIYPPDMVFSGQETSGYAVFTTLHNDVREFTVHVPEVVVRFDYKGEPVETIDLEYKFQRELYKALHPREARQ